MLLVVRAFHKERGDERSAPYPGPSAMSVEAVRNRDGALRRDRDGAIVHRVRWRDETGQARSNVVGKRRDAEAFDAKLKEARRLGGLGLLEAGRETLDEYVEGTWALTHAAHLAPKTRSLYAYLYDVHIAPRLGPTALRDLNPEVSHVGTPTSSPAAPARSRPKRLSSCSAASCSVRQRHGAFPTTRRVSSASHCFHPPKRSGHWRRRPWSASAVG